MLVKDDVPGKKSIPTHMYIQTKQPFPLFSSFCCPVASNIKEVDAGDDAIELKRGLCQVSVFDYFLLSTFV